MALPRESWWTKYITRPLTNGHNDGGGGTLRQPPPRKNKALLLDITIANPCAISNLENTVCHPGKYHTDAVKRENNKYRGSFLVTYSLLPLAVSTCGEASSDAHVLIKELAIRWVEHRSCVHSNESRNLASGTEVARLRRRLSYILQQALSFRTRHHLCRQRVTLEGTQQLRLQGPEPVHAHCTRG